MTDEKSETSIEENEPLGTERYKPPAKAEDEESLVEDTYHNPNKLIKIASWANTFSWVILVVVVVASFLQGWLNYQQVQQYQQIPNIIYYYYGSDLLKSLLTGGFYFLVLQAVSEGINILMDIFEGPADEG